MARTVGETLEELIAERAGGITSLRGLARRLAELDQRQTRASWERTVKRWRRGEITPTAESVTLLSEAFRVPRSRFPDETRPTLRMLHRRLEALEAELDQLEQVVEAGFALLGLRAEPVSPRAAPRVAPGRRTPPAGDV